ncbi:MAG: DUF1684 domain-containing protein [Chloroflexi bacterium]|nr:DUF1684 domain-containing protein [Chloroflexota bacterium]
MTSLAEFRERKDAYFRTPRSPLTPEQHKTFAGLRYFAENSALRFRVRINRLLKVQTVQMQTSTGHLASYLRYGHVEFDVNGEPQTLTIYKSEDHDALFLPFADATSGVESYGAGRYLDPAPEPDGAIVLDFNLAYSPYCAYNDQWTCPIPPAENRLKVRIDAGEMKYREE